MKFESPHSSRLSIDNQLIELTITLRAIKRPVALAFVTFWLGGWTVGGITAMRSFDPSLDDGGDYFLLFWLGGWVVGWFWAAFFLCWGFLGYERIFADKTVLTLQRVIFVPIRTRHFDLTTIGPFQFDSQPVNWLRRRGISADGIFGQDSVSFDYGTRTIRFGSELDNAESEAVVDALEGHMKRVGI